MPAPNRPRQYTLPAGAWTSIPVTTFCRRMKMQEDDSTSQGGIMVKYNDGVTVSYSAASQPVWFGDETVNQIGRGNPLGYPQQTDTKGNVTRAADAYCQVQPMAGLASLLNVFEYE